MSKRPIGTFVNMATVAVGSVIGLMLREVFPENIQNITTLAVGLSILIIGIRMSIKVPEEYLLVFIFSLVFGGILGEFMGVGTFLDNFRYTIETRFQIDQYSFREGFMTAFILFCASSIAVVGAIEEGIQGKRELLYVKSVLDGVTAIWLASSFGIGVLLSIIPMFLIQGGLTILARESKLLFTKNIIAMLSAVGGALIIAIALKILVFDATGQGDLLRIANLLPSLVLAVFLTWASGKLGLKI